MHSPPITPPEFRLRGRDGAADSSCSGTRLLILLRVQTKSGKCCELAERVIVRIRAKKYVWIQENG